MDDLAELLLRDDRKLGYRLDPTSTDKEQVVPLLMFADDIILLNSTPQAMVLCFIVVSNVMGGDLDL